MRPSDVVVEIADHLLARPSGFEWEVLAVVSGARLEALRMDDRMDVTLETALDDGEGRFEWQVRALRRVALTPMTCTVWSDVVARGDRTSSAMFWFRTEAIRAASEVVLECRGAEGSSGVLSARITGRFGGRDASDPGVSRMGRAPPSA